MRNLGSLHFDMSETWWVPRSKARWLHGLLEVPQLNVNSDGRAADGLLLDAAGGRQGKLGESALEVGPVVLRTVTFPDQPFWLRRIFPSSKSVNRLLIPLKKDLQGTSFRGPLPKGQLLCQQLNCTTAKFLQISRVNDEHIVN